MDRAFRSLATARAALTPAQLDLIGEGFARYWERSAGLARRAATWPPPRRRHLGIVVGDPLAVRPYAQLLNTATWLLYLADVDPATSHPELLAWLLALGDRMAVTGEVTLAPVQSAAWWLERTDAECVAFAAAAARSTRPDADAIRATADALPWLRRLAHETLRPPVAGARQRSIPRTGLLVPPELEAEPPALAARWTAIGRATLAAYRGRWRGSSPSAVRDVTTWLVTSVPPVLVTGEGGRIVWDPDVPDRIGPVRSALRDADAVSVRAVHDDLVVVARVTRAFHAAVTEHDALPAPDAGTAASGYTYLHAARRRIAYNLHEPGMERLHGPPLPYARAMVAARTAHEWGHLADAAGWIPRTIPDADYAASMAALGDALDRVVAAAPLAVRRATAADLAELGRDGGVGAALARLTLGRLPDWRANLVARHLLRSDERETYVRHNVRRLGDEYPPPALWRLLIRHLFEYQYLGPALGMTGVTDTRSFYVHSTGVADELLATGVLDDATFDALAAAVERCCACHAVDTARLRLGPVG